MGLETGFHPGLCNDLRVCRQWTQAFRLQSVQLLQPWPSWKSSAMPKTLRCSVAHVSTVAASLETSATTTSVWLQTGFQRRTRNQDRSRLTALNVSSSTCSVIIVAVLPGLHRQATERQLWPVHGKTCVMVLIVGFSSHGFSDGHFMRRCIKKR